MIRTVSCSTAQRTIKSQLYILHKSIFYCQKLKLFPISQCLHRHPQPRVHYLYLAPCMSHQEIEFGGGLDNLLPTRAPTRAYYVGMRRELKCRVHHSIRNGYFPETRISEEETKKRMVPVRN